KPSLKLAADDMPVTGRVVDLEGQPIAGVEVRTSYMYVAENGNLDAWIAAVRRGEFPPSAARHLGDSLPQVDSLSPQAVTDADGRFRIDGLGRERLVEVAFSGPTIGYSQARLVTRRTEPFTQRMGGGAVDPSIPVYGADLEFAAAPTQPIVGVVRDAKTGRPLSDVSIESWRFPGGNYVDQRAVRVVTDAAGRYRLAGMPKGKGNEILAVPNDDQPYFMRKMDVPDPQGLEPISVDIKLHRGIWVKGRVTDLATREPLPARLYYLPFQSNAFAHEFPEFHPPAYHVDGYQQRYATRPDGTYRLVALPGRAIIGALSLMHPYRHGVGAEAIAGMNDHGTFDTYLNPVQPGKKWPNILKEIDPQPGVDEIVCNLALDRGATITVDVVDAEGRPLTGFEVEGRSADYEAMSPAAESRVDVVNLGPDENRTVVIRHKELGIGKVVRLRTADHPNGHASATLARYASVVGRLLDRNGDPVVGAEITAWVQPTEDFGERLAPVATDRDGRFEYLDVPTGCPYGLQTKARGMSHAEVAGDLRLTPGERKDLGDVTVGGEAKANDKPAAQPAVKRPSANDVSSAPSSSQVQLSGSVVGPSGQPLAGATVDVRLAVTDAPDPPLGSATADASGRFQIGFAWPQSDRRIAAKPDLLVVATAEGRAADWKYLPKDEVPGEIVLRLPDEKAIHGRVVNSEGKPLAGVELRVREVARYDRDTMRLLLDDVAQGRTILRTYKDWGYGPLPRQPAHVTTAADGRFQIAGLATDTVVKLQIRGTGVRETMFHATTAVRNTVRSSTPAAEPYAARAASILYGSELEYVAEPSRRIQGVVGDRESGRPVPGAKVSCSQQTAALGGYLHSIEAETDAAGRYSLDGCGKEPRSFFRVDPPADGPAHFPVEFLLEDTPGIEPVVQDVQLVKGIELRGRIVDNETGQPLVASVQYAPLYLNTYAAPLYKQQASLRCYARSKTDGSFRIVVAPGPGALAVSRPSVESQEYTTIRVSHDDLVRLFEASAKHRDLARSADLMRGFPDSVPTQTDGGWGLLSQTGNARTVLISPDEDKTPEPLEVQLVRGHRIRGQVVDPDGKPLIGVTAYLNNPGILWQPLPSGDFTVSALATGEKRDVAFHHEQRKLGAFRTVTADEPEPLIVRLEPCGAAVGRLLDEEGAPVEGRHVWFYRVGDYGSTELFSITDAEGRFRIEELIPGQPYEVLRSEPGSRSRLQFSRDKRVFSVGSGQTHDLGDVVVKGAS
ncbi:MAG TPA: carboxypeptidase-like regulatory domain-containing protein, partial [Pirellulales bacterium]|nr:carboxypeptidase-like regulatory domain-containing protein [Pirellulales bacterium]